MAAIVEEPQGVEVVTVEAAPGEVDDLIIDLESDPDVIDAFVDTPVRAFADDPLRTDQWAHDALDFFHIPTWAPDGTGVVVAVLDTGVQASHPDLAGRVDCALGADFASDQAVADPADDGCTDANGHGTHVAGILAATTGNGIGMHGVSGATIMPVRVLDANGQGMTSDIVAGIDYAVANGADVINLSLGGNDAAGFDRAVADAVAAGVVVVAAAGNNRMEGNQPSYPAATPGALSVAATDWLGLSAPFSYSGPRNWISAPGSHVLSTTVEWNGSTPVHGYGEMSGTSAATPHVAGAIARYLHRVPGASPDGVRSALAETAVDLERSGWDSNTGNGLVDVYELTFGHQPSRPFRFTPPAAPLLTGVTPGDGRLKATWTPPDWDGGTAVTGYGMDVWRVRGDELQFVRSTIVPAGHRSATVRGLPGGRTYAATVYGLNEVGEGQWSEISDPTRVVAAPGAPAVGTPNAGPGAARVRWTAPTTHGGSPVTGYVVKAYRGWTLVKTVSVPASARDVRIGGLVNGQAHTFLVQAVNAVGTSRHSARSIKVTPFARPGVPRVGRPASLNNAARVYWAGPADDGGAAITAYVVKVYQGSRGIKRVTVRGTARSVAVTGLRHNAYYQFTVTAKTVYGSGPSTPRSPTVRTR